MEKEIQHNGPIIYKGEKFSIVDCVECGFKHILPLPSLEDIEEFYGTFFYENLWPDAIKNSSKDLEWDRVGFKEKYDKLEELLSDAKARTLLDIGSGAGYFLQYGEERKWNVMGMEPNETAFKFSTEYLNLDIKKSNFDKGNYNQFGTFDVVTLNKVFEHLVNPQNTLSLVHKILKPNGLICITVPNDFNPLQEIVCDYYDKEQWWIDPKEHVNYFDKDSLQRLLDKNGFKTEFITSEFPLELFILMGDDYVNDSEIGKTIHNKRKKLELIFEKSGNTPLKREIYNNLLSLGLGRELIIYARKN